MRVVRLTAAYNGALSIVAVGTVYLGAVAHGSAPLICPAPKPGGLINCAAVLRSAGSHVLGMPLVWLGTGWAGIGLFLLKRCGGRRFWQGFGGAGVPGAVGHEITLGRVCLICTGIQSAVVMACLLVPARAIGQITRESHHTVVKAYQQEELR